MEFETYYDYIFERWVLTAKNPSHNNNIVSMYTMFSPREVVEGGFILEDMFRFQAGKILDHYNGRDKLLELEFIFTRSKYDTFDPEHFDIYDKMSVTSNIKLVS